MYRSGHPSQWQAHRDSPTIFALISTGYSGPRNLQVQRRARPMSRLFSIVPISTTLIAKTHSANLPTISRKTLVSPQRPMSLLGRLRGRLDHGLVLPFQQGIRLTQTKRLPGK